MQKKMLFQKELVLYLKMNYLLYLPKQYFDEAKSRWPLLLFLHGSGEIGNDLELLRPQGLPKILEHGGDFPFIAVSPQCPEGSSWHNEFETLDELLQFIQDDYRVDPNRIYLTGLSMGGFAAWDYALMRPETFAAVIPICGGSSYHDHLELIKDIPVWAFHGALDDIVPLSESETAVRLLRKAGGNVKLTVYPDAGHDSWSATYDNPEVFQWLLQQIKRNPDKSTM